LAGPELSRVSDEFKSLLGINVRETGEHHGLTKSVLEQEHIAIDKIKVLACHEA
jgi:hypothetical protein